MKAGLIDAPWGTLALDVSVTTGVRDRLKGWMGRKTIASRDALLIRPCNSVHTYFMRHAIDVLFLDADGGVLAVHASVPPRRLRAHWRAAATLELRAGRAAELNLAPGIALRLDHGETP